MVKKFIAILTLVCMLMSLMTFASFAEETEVAHESHEYQWNGGAKKYVCACGDVYRRFVLDLDGDATATMADAMELLRTIDKVGSLPAYLADVTGDGKVVVYDAVRYLQLMNVYGDDELGDASVLDGKKVIFIGNSMTYYGRTVMEKAQTKLTQAERDNDTGFFYQICKANGAEVDVTNWTFGGHSLEHLFGGNCSADRGCDGVDHASYLVDRNYDYVVFQQGAGHTEGFVWQDYVIEFFKEANPDVKFIYLEQSGAYLNDYPRVEELDYLREKGVTVVEWGRLVEDVINGTTEVPGATQTYTKNSFIISKSKDDGYHPNLITGYITSSMTFAAITGCRVEGQTYAFCNDKTISKYFDFERFANTYYTYSPSNFYEIYQSEADMLGLQILMDRYLAQYTFK